MSEIYKIELQTEDIEVVQLIEILRKIDDIMPRLHLLSIKNIP
jgi:hypothetical protein